MKARHRKILNMVNSLHSDASGAESIVPVSHQVLDLNDLLSNHKMLHRVAVPLEKLKEKYKSSTAAVASRKSKVIALDGSFSKAFQSE